MLFINYKIHVGRDELLDVIRNSDRVVGEENYDLSKGTPKMHVKEKGDSLKIRCEMTGRPTKDNGFLEGTYFKGKIKEKDGIATLKGVILTAPIYHSLLALLFAYFIYMCFSLGGINVVPIILLVFSIFMFKDEFRKQNLIKRYVFRSLKIAYREASSQNKKTKED